MDIIAILLAAGESERMGTPKGLLAWRGQPLLAHQVQQIQRSRVSECVVVLGREADRLEPLVHTPRHPVRKAHTVHNPRAGQGKCSSILAGLTSLPQRPDGVLIASVDQPLDHRLLDAMLLAAETEWDRSEAVGRRTILVPVCQGRRGHPPLFCGSLMAELMGITEEGQGLKAVVRRQHERVLEVPWASPEILLNLNTPHDLGAGDPPRDRPHETT
jgi:molybdenum cofactor cytidylyltransferase